MTSFFIIKIKHQALNMELTSDLAHQFRQFLELEWNLKRDIVLDLSEVENISSSAIGVLIELRNNISKYSNELYCIYLSKQVEKVFELTKLNTFFKIYKNYEELQKNR